MLLPDRYSFIPRWISATVPLWCCGSSLSSSLRSSLTRSVGQPDRFWLAPAVAAGHTHAAAASRLVLARSRITRRAASHALSVTFRLDPDHRVIEQGLAIDPPIRGTMKWQGRTLVFTPEPGWQPDQMYRITVKYAIMCCPVARVGPSLHGLSSACSRPARRTRSTGRSDQYSV